MDFRGVSGQLLIPLVYRSGLCPDGDDVAGHVVLLHGLVQVGLGELAQSRF